MPRPKLVPLKPAKLHAIADAAARLRHVFVRDLVLDARVGVMRRERGVLQRVRINLDLAVIEDQAALSDRLADVVCYDAITQDVRRLVAARHVNLIETLAERIAALCLERPRVRSARVRVEKLDVYPDAASVGVEIERRRGGGPATP
ncbi:MAG TPA: dihydroneopterin aldolase [Alphaproteobacteria bacterium]|jgi:dihydroneopterin aldolase|nr:dihydroneopterin aldolase [Alphaproteobacteria bacterium]